MMMARDHAQFVVAIDYLLELLRANTSSSSGDPLNKARNVSLGQEVTEGSGPEGEQFEILF